VFLLLAGMLLPCLADAKNCDLFEFAPLHSEILSLWMFFGETPLLNDLMLKYALNGHFFSIDKSCLYDSTQMLYQYRFLALVKGYYALFALLLTEIATNETVA
jgi:hypothetical protein